MSKEPSFTVEGVTYVQEYRRCGRACATCDNGPGHGPYWYAKQRVGGTVRSYYVGKQLPAGVGGPRHGAA